MNLGKTETLKPVETTNNRNIVTTEDKKVIT